MTQRERLKYCTVCKNRVYNRDLGTICNLTYRPAAFDLTCPDFIQDERSDELAVEHSLETKKSDNKTMNKGRLALYFIGAIDVLVACLLIFAQNNYIDGFVNLFFGCLFIAVSIWSYWQPFIAFITGLGTYVLLNLLMIYVDPTYIYKGAFIKIIVIIALVYSIKKAKELRDEQKTIKEDLIDQV
ncbi:MAG: hypothetical protein RL264_2849 [Bacteroidota bacterium]|jgi:hypothetical protein